MSDRRYSYGRTFVSFPARPKEQTLTRIVGGVPLVYVRKGDDVRVYDGTKQLAVPREAQRRIVAAWPDDPDSTDLIDWWGE